MPARCRSYTAVVADRASSVTPAELAAAPDDIRWAYKKTVTLAQSGIRLRFGASQDLFSSATIDAGTALLIRTLADKDYARAAGSVLDIGCGYGPLGLFMAKLNPQASVRCTDRDLLAVQFTRFNAGLNGIKDVDCAAMLDVGDGGPYDLILSNIPAKAGAAVITELLLRAARTLTANGVVAVVVIDRITELVESVLVANGATVLERVSARGYTCFHYLGLGGESPAGSMFTAGLYDRSKGTIGSGTEITTVWGLPEFDTPSHDTELAAELVPAGRRAVVAFPGQGYLPRLLADRGASDVELLDRDVLALANSERNLAGRAEVISTLTTGLAPAGTGYDVALLSLRPAALPSDGMLAELRAAMATRGSIVVHGRSTDVTRVLASLRLDGRRVKRKGFSAVRLTV
jgi:16S rRNA (guanine1207-N2)-methyltransferase